MDPEAGAKVLEEAAVPWVLVPEVPGGILGDGSEQGQGWYGLGTPDLWRALGLGEAKARCQDFCCCCHKVDSVSESRVQ